MKVDLENTKKEVRSFDHEVAHRLLRNPSIKTWFLPKKSDWKIDPSTNDLIRRKNTDKSRGEAEQGDNPSGSESSSEA